MVILSLTKSMSVMGCWIDRAAFFKHNEKYIYKLEPDLMVD